MMKAKRDRSLEDRLHWVAFENNRKLSEENNSREIMRRVSERVGKRIEEIFSDKKVRISK
jgi:hypothetical protein